jgi:hypothetical protein
VELDESNDTKMHEKGRTMGRPITIKQAISKVGSRLQGKIHIEDWIDIQNERIAYFNETDLTMQLNHDKPTECYKHLARLGAISRAHFEKRWKPDVLNAFCQIEGVFDILQRKPYTNGNGKRS